MVKSCPLDVVDPKLQGSGAHTSKFLKISTFLVVRRNNWTAGEIIPPPCIIDGGHEKLGTCGPIWQRSQSSWQTGWPPYDFRILLLNTRLTRLLQ